LILQETIKNNKNRKLPKATKNNKNNKIKKKPTITENNKNHQKNNKK
jgi:hypothetical protein